MPGAMVMVTPLPTLMGCIVSPNPYAGSLALVPQNMTVLGDGASKEVIELK